jgi:hypothetical protein
MVGVVFCFVSFFWRNKTKQRFPQVADAPHKSHLFFSLLLVFLCQERQFQSSLELAKMRRRSTLHPIMRNLGALAEQTSATAPPCSPGRTYKPLGVPMEPFAEPKLPSEHPRNKPVLQKPLQQAPRNKLTTSEQTQQTRPTPLPAKSANVLLAVLVTSG